MTTSGTGEYRSSDRSILVKTRLDWRPRDVTLWASEVDDVVLFEGDIVLTTIREGEAIRELNDPKRVLEHPEGTGASPQGLEQIADGRPHSLWIGRTVYYEIADGFSSEALKHIDESIAQWSDLTVVKFVRRRSATHKVLFRSGSGCCSEVGMNLGGEQCITLGRGCTAGNVLHEIGHAVGLCHEHSRPDRKNYIEIHWHNIPEKDHIHFNQLTEDLVIATREYDYGSIMHYKHNAFAIDETKPTITAHNGARIGQREGLSRLDIATVALLYEKVTPS